MKYSWLISLLLLGACKEAPNPLIGKEQPLEVQAVSWACDCANWATPADIRKYYNSGDTLAQHCIFIEPATTHLALPDTLGYNGDIIRFTGKFYRDKTFPQNYPGREPVNTARVFRYTKYKIIKSTFKEIKKEKLLRQSGGGKVFLQH